MFSERNGGTEIRVDKGYRESEGVIRGHEHLQVRIEVETLKAKSAWGTN